MGGRLNPVKYVNDAVIASMAGGKPKAPEMTAIFSVTKWRGEDQIRSHHFTSEHLDDSVAHCVPSEIGDRMQI
jgi:hypothetical protein